MNSQISKIKAFINEYTNFYLIIKNNHNRWLYIHKDTITTGNEFGTYLLEQLYTSYDIIRQEDIIDNQYLYLCKVKKIPNEQSIIEKIYNYILYHFDFSTSFNISFKEDTSKYIDTASFNQDELLIINTIVKEKLLYIISQCQDNYTLKQKLNISIF